jgi:hypothetical protein
VNSRLSSAAANSSARFHPKELISNGNKSSSSAAGFEPGTCSALDNKNYNRFSSYSRENDENETENEFSIL